MRPVVFRCGELFRGSRCVWAWICCVCGALRGIVPGVLLCGVVVGAGVVAGWRGGFLEIRSGAFVWEAVRGGFPGRLAGVAVRGGCPGWLSGSFVRRICSGCPSAHALHFGISRSPMPDPDVFLCVFWRLPGCSECMPAVWCPYDADFSAPAQIFEQAIVFMYIFAGRRQTIT